MKWAPTCRQPKKLEETTSDKKQTNSQDKKREIVP